MGRRRRGVVAVAVAVLAMVTARLFGWPSGDVPAAVDAVLVLGGDDAERLRTAVRLVESGAAPVLVVSTGPNDKMAAAGLTCGQAGAFSVLCFEPDPDSTAGEAAWLGEQARRNGWRAVAVVTSEYHLFRSRLLFRRCFEGQLLMIPAGSSRLSPSYWLWAAREWPAVVWAMIGQRGCVASRT